jgi:ABC-type nitrate/sulfonate/bicarbonate transport system substrate-binding protein
VQIVVPDLSDLQLLAFWTALGGGYFAQEGIDVTPVAPPSPGQAGQIFRANGFPAAILNGPEYEQAIADGFPMLLVANLLENDPAELVVKREVVARIAVNMEMPLRSRLRAMGNTNIGVAVPDRARLYEMFHSAGLDVNQARVRVRKPEELLADFASGAIDGYLTGSPNLEKAMTDLDGVVLGDMAGGEVPKYAKRMVQALAVTRAYARDHRDVVDGLVRAIGRAEITIRSRPTEAAAAITRALPQASLGRVNRLLEVYTHAVPKTPRVEAERIQKELHLYPAELSPPKLEGVDLKAFIYNPAGPKTGGLSPRGGLFLALSIAVLLVLLVAFLESREAKERAA